LKDGNVKCPGGGPPTRGGEGKNSEKKLGGWVTKKEEKMD